MDFIRGVLKRHAPSRIKRSLWDEEFSSSKWNFIDNTAGDCVYLYLQKYLGGGNILDLGCGPGNTANELEESAYRVYVGVDISEAALAKARKRTAECGRTNKNLFLQGDFLSYVPGSKFDVILFRESMYHVPLGKVKAVLDRYSQYLTDTGVFVVRMATSDTQGNTKYRPAAMIGVMETEFDVFEKVQHGEGGPTVIVFQPKHVPIVASVN